MASEQGKSTDSLTAVLNLILIVSSIFITLLWIFGIPMRYGLFSLDMLIFIVILALIWLIAIPFLFSLSFATFLEGLGTLLLGALLASPGIVLFVSFFLTGKVMEKQLTLGYVVFSAAIVLKTLWLWILSVLRPYKAPAPKGRGFNFEAMEDPLRSWDDTGSGIITGYEPSVFKSIPLERTPLMFGSPGIGRVWQGFESPQVIMNRFGALNFAKALQMEALNCKFAFFWSVHIPGDPFGYTQDLESDVDCIIVTGSSVFLVDIKNYEQGNVSWHESNGYVVMEDRSMLIEPAIQLEMTMSMQHATEIVLDKLNNEKIPNWVTPRIVFMPRTYGIGDIRATWPGDSLALGLPDMLKELAQEPPLDLDNPDTEKLINIFRGYLESSEFIPVQPGVLPEEEPKPSTSKLLKLVRLVFL